MKTSRLSQPLSKPAMKHIAMAISLFGLMVWILEDTLNDLENNSWGLSTRFTENRQIATVFALKIFGMCFVGVGTIKLGVFFFRHISSRILNSLLLTTLIGVAAIFIFVYADVFRIFGLIDTAN
jgi:hypothetical protein